ncbi:MAG: ABC transporter permease [Trueperella sp.]|nr:ABC transporter permease [Trueperella sp.]
MRRLIQDLVVSRELIRNLTMREVKGKYKRTALGQFWSLANPLSLMLVYGFIFAIVIRVQVAPGDPSGLNVFVLWLMCGLLPWTFLSKVIDGSMDAIVLNENLIKKVYFSRSALIFSNTLAALYQHAMELLILVLAFFLMGNNVLIYLPMVIVTTLLLALFATGIGFLVSIANAYFHDVKHFVGILLQLGFYASPIVYPVIYVKEVSNKVGDLVGGISLLDVYNLNPFVHFATAMRNLLYDGRWPDWHSYGIMAVVSIVTFLIGWVIFYRRQDYLAELL